MKPMHGIGRRNRLAPGFFTALVFATGLFAVHCGKSGDVSGPARDNFGADTTGLVKLDAARPIDTLRVASLNMSIGFPVSQLFFTNMDDTAIAFDALVDMYGRYQKGYPTERIKAMAKVIAAESLDVVGLQEVMVLRKSDTLINDFLSELRAAIVAEGGPPYTVFRTVMNDTMMRGKKGTESITLDFREGQALLVRPTFTVLDSVRFPYFSLLPIPVQGEPKTERGADYLRVKTPRGTEFQVFNTHLEVELGNYAQSQSEELARMGDSLQVRVSGRGRLQLILGDFNSDPGVRCHQTIRSRGFVDTFDGVAQDLGATCCVSRSELWRPDSATFSNRRIDYVMARGLVQSLFSRTNVKGPYTGAGGVRFLASDHRMVVARLVAQ